MVDLEEIVEALRGGGQRIPGVESPLTLRKVNYTLSSAFFSFVFFGYFSEESINNNL